MTGRILPPVLVAASVALMFIGGAMPSRAGLVVVDLLAIAAVAAAAGLILMLSLRAAREAVAGERWLRRGIAGVAVAAAIGAVVAIGMNIADPLGISFAVPIIWLPASLVLLTTSLLVLALPSGPAPRWQL
ncbi:hypothetical protein [Brevibacterium luteolum]|uniref:Uncharacterized protein n=1 Tax=Brevibacterium luteolum TaxID=199591 RepID=A0A849AS44_9MICO|nr:hypothetical protein [Brevibacterium luteolum]MBM7529993.1 hypothetical protein [Brevibacterium luteolum]MCT1656048.1 hypothetical protein [Brevibacterium luteolum]NNG78745.1 hypothetical protein [Brevibacterium luteolum]